MRQWILAALVSCVVVKSSDAKELMTNSIHFVTAPSWLTERQLNTTTRRIENVLEWDIRRVKAYSYPNQRSFEAVHRLGPRVVAFFRRADGSLHIGPKVNSENFDPIFAHETVHLIFSQKYKKSIPSWLEEGLANYLGRMNAVDYGWLSKQTWGDVKSLKHPYRDASGSRVHYAVSTALIEMISAKCPLSDLLHLSVGRSMENYLDTYCGFSDLNGSFNKWVKAKSVKSD